MEDIKYQKEFIDLLIAVKYFRLYMNNSTIKNSGMCDSEKVTALKHAKKLDKLIKKYNKYLPKPF